MLFCVNYEFITYTSISKWLPCVASWEDIAACFAIAMHPQKLQGKQSGRHVSTSHVCEGIPGRKENYSSL